MKAVVAVAPGGVEQLRYIDVDKPAPGSGHVLVKIAASGVNFIDVYFRTGLYKADSPIALGMEGAGTVEAVGEGVIGLRVGDRVAYAMSRGSYAEYAVVPARLLVKVPEAVDLEVAAASMLQGMTAHYLTHSTFPLQPGQTALVHAAAGGTGLLIDQMAKLRGARVFGTVGSRGKAEAARAAGCDEVILYNETDFEAEVKRLAHGGVDVVYDSVGANTFLKGLNCLRPRGMMVAFGQSSGPAPPIDLLQLSSKGSLFLTRPTLAHHLTSAEELNWHAGELLGWIAGGKLRVQISHKYPLSEAARAHQDLESRKTSGKLLLIP